MKYKSYIVISIMSRDLSLLEVEFNIGIKREVKYLELEVKPELNECISDIYLGRTDYKELVIEGAVKDHIEKVGEEWFSKYFIKQIREDKAVVKFRLLKDLTEDEIEDFILNRKEYITFESLDFMSGRIRAAAIKRDCENLFQMGLMTTAKEVYLAIEEYLDNTDKYKNLYNTPFYSLKKLTRKHISSLSDKYGERFISYLDTLNSDYYGK